MKTGNNLFTKAVSVMCVKVCTCQNMKHLTPYFYYVYGKLGSILTFEKDA